MKTELKIENCANPFCVIHAAEKNAMIEKLVDKISTLDETGNEIKINGWDGDYCIPLKANNIYRVFSQNKKVYVQTEKETLELKLRLYEFEELTGNNGLNDFIRISNTDFVNLQKVVNFDMSLSGIIKVNLNNDTNAIVSRRYMSKIKEFICLKK